MIYRIVKLTYENDEEYYAIQRRKKSWLTGRIYWQYLEGSYYSYEWTRYPKYAERFGSIRDAEQEIDRIKHTYAMCRGPVNINIEKTYERGD